MIERWGRRIEHLRISRPTEIARIIPERPRDIRFIELMPTGPSLDLRAEKLFSCRAGEDSPPPLRKPDRRVR